MQGRLQQAHDRRTMNELLLGYNNQIMGGWFRREAESKTGGEETQEEEDIDYDLKKKEIGEDEVDSSDFEDVEEWLGVERKGGHHENEGMGSSDNDDDDEDGGEMMPVFNF
mmetsp:Transcript_8519/g.14354  ORF Transcript_8519/g.14354 Transcript_8519/m.14354 type:complete len:111 (-) Transcript_8519:139-471(-)